jgi:hypothetical protein
MDTGPGDDHPLKGRRKGKKEGAHDDSNKKRRCISSACVPCRKRKSKVRRAPLCCRASKLFLRDDSADST